LLMRLENRRHFNMMAAIKYFFPLSYVHGCITFSAYNIQKINYTNKCIASTILHFLECGACTNKRIYSFEMKKPQPEYLNGE
jgi:hypothetical protein